ncbi:HAD family hydrolase [Salisediminibacterium selenitireducens]|uniref:HAD-superfamily subfamily IB hydrolase, TIGR01490 n=1 Tax=Bacillus selenitireducens (strain ATCC 700615 / DSM 15326 / MLS10) TaxID=439292 RepID=D6XZB6_BACIE|nr:HAD family hydrolase [Salisediminibacterium selenitireducens]ADI00401.1 HAD-superfamily subfamily IB hydrolase, TIGR01490 [[Bacillus] selenitireducens MLS10]
MAIVTVDFDGTLYQGDSFKAMFKAGKKHFGWRQWLTMGVEVVASLFVWLFQNKQAMKMRFFRGFAMTFKGMTTEEINSFFRDLAGSDWDNVNIELVEKLKEHEKRGDRLVILSGALYPFLEAFRELLDVEADIISTRLGFTKDGVCTGEIARIINGEEKVTALKAWLKKEGLEPTFGESDLYTWAYADSETDIPLFEYVHRPVVVNPDEQMMSIAREKRWPIFDEALADL